MPPALPISLAIMRLSLGVFFTIWALAKILAPASATRVSETFYGFTPDVTFLVIVGAVQLILIAAFVAGLFKTLTYGSLLVIHVASVLTTWERLIDPYTSPNALFWAGIPVIAMLVALFLLREQDTWLTWKRR
jgi:hypothetical protein